MDKYNFRVLHRGENEREFFRKKTCLLTRFFTGIVFDFVKKNCHFDNFTLHNCNIFYYLDHFPHQTKACRGAKGTYKKTARDSFTRLKKTKDRTRVTFLYQNQLFSKTEQNSPATLRYIFRHFL